MTPILAEVADPDGRRVVLDDISWEHILFGHPAMNTAQAAILATVERPDHREPDPVAGRERFYSRDAGPGNWLRVVVDFSQVPGYVVTSFPQRRAPVKWSNRKR